MNASERLAWLESRRSGIGSSDVAPILGMSPWQTALDIYESKVNPVVERELPPALEWGTRAEPMIAGAIADRYGWKIQKIATLTHLEHSFLIASTDRENQDEEPIEIKTASRADGWGDAETADIPLYYWPQCQHQLEVRRSRGRNHEAIWVFVLIGGNDFRRYRVPYDPEYLPTVIDPLAEFWACVTTRTPPEPDWSHPTTLATVQRLHSPTAGKTTILPGECDALVDSYQRLGEEEKAAKEARDECKARLIHALGDCEVGTLLDGRSVARKQVNRKGYAVEPTSYFSFAVKELKTGKS